MTNMDEVGTNNLRFLFNNMFNQTEMIQANLQDIELVDPEFAAGACRSLEKFAHLVVNPREVEYYGHLLSGARALFTSSSEGMSIIDLLQRPSDFASSLTSNFTTALPANDS